MCWETATGPWLSLHRAPPSGPAGVEDQLKPIYDFKSSPEQKLTGTGSPTLQVLRSVPLTAAREGHFQRKSETKTRQEFPWLCLMQSNYLGKPLWLLVIGCPLTLRGFFVCLLVFALF